MSLETDGLVVAFQSSGLPGVPTEINKPGAHGKTSNHYRLATKGVPRSFARCYDHSTGGLGTAIDFGFMVGQRDSPGLLAIFQWWWERRKVFKLTELIYSGPGVTHWVSGGQVKARSAMGKDLASAHHNHVHVAVARGTILAAWPTAQAPTLASAPPPSKEDTDMSRAVAQITWSNGGHTQVFANGVVFPNGPIAQPLPFFGDMGNLPAERKRSFAEAVDIVPVDINDPQRGYTVIAQDRSAYTFDANEYARILSGKWPAS